MRLEHLQAFLAVVDSGSFQRAAHDCGVTQSTISRQIQSLEAELGTPVLHRGGPIKCTIAGEVLLPHARKICQSWGRVHEEVGALLSGQQTELCIAGIHSLVAHGLPCVLEPFARDYPDVQLRVTALGSDRALKVLKDGLVDLALVMDNPLLTRTADMVIAPLYEEAISVLMAANHPLREWDVIPWAVLADYPQAVFKDGYGMRSLVQRHLSQLGLSLRVALELNTLDAFRGVVRQGHLIALMPQSAVIDSLSDPELVMRPTTAPTLRRQVVMVTTCDRQQIPPIQRFFQLACELIPVAIGLTAPRFRPSVLPGSLL